MWAVACSDDSSGMGMLQRRIAQFGRPGIGLVIGLVFFFVGAPVGAGEPANSTAPVVGATNTQPPTRPVTSSVRPVGTHRARVVDLRDIVRGGQRTIDSCRITLYRGPLPGYSGGTVWLAGHDWCGFSSWASLRTGTVVVLHGSWGVVRYRVYGHRSVGRQGGSSAGLIRGDLTLQTCRGSSTAFTYARQIRSPNAVRDRLSRSMPPAPSSRRP